MHVQNENNKNQKLENGVSTIKIVLTKMNDKKLLSLSMNITNKYKCVQNKSLRSRYMKQNTDFQEGISQP